MIRLGYGMLAMALCYLSIFPLLHEAQNANSEHDSHLIEVRSAANGGDAGPVWVVQVSDLHFSSYHPQRSLFFRELLTPILTLINPSLVLITGDLTDGKSKDLAAMRQDESEWVQYRDALNWVVSKSGLPAHIFFDIRGNHDKFGVPEAGGSFDYFSKYSISALQNRTASVQSITLLKGDWKHLFVGIDLTMDIGLCGPCNLFGHAGNEELDLLDRQLSQWDDDKHKMVTKIVFGHFPTSFIASTKDGKRPEEIFAKHKILAYLCGHLHYQFGRNLLKHHMFKSMEGDFWEWELGDWKENRVVRIMAIDHGQASFLDLDLFDWEKSFSDDKLLLSKAFILITHPPNARTMQRRGLNLTTNSENSVRALVFSHGVVVSAKALIYDTYHSSQTPVEELPLKQLPIDVDSVHYFAAPMSFINYCDMSLTRFFLKVLAFDASGKQFASDLVPFSTGSQFGKLRWSWKEYFVMGIVWDALYVPLLCGSFGALLIILFVPELYYHLVMEKSVIFACRKRKTGLATHSFLNEVLVQARNATATIRWMQLLLVGYLMFMPWFWGDVLGGSCSLGSMSVRGWSVRIPSSEERKSGLGVPDIIVIVLPFLFHILLPLFVLVLALYAEQALVCEHVRQDSQRFTGSNEQTEPIFSCKICRRWLRKALLVACLGVAYLHAQRTQAIVGAYGVMAMLISPGYVWPVPFLLVVALLQSARVNTFCSKQKICNKPSCQNKGGNL